MVFSNLNCNLDEMRDLVRTDAIDALDVKATKVSQISEKNSDLTVPSPSL